MNFTVLLGDLNGLKLKIYCILKVYSFNYTEILLKYQSHLVHIISILNFRFLRVFLCLKMFKNLYCPCGIFTHSFIKNINISSTKERWEVIYVFLFATLNNLFDDCRKTISHQFCPINIWFLLRNNNTQGVWMTIQSWWTHLTSHILLMCLFAQKVNSSSKH